MKKALKIGLAAVGVLVLLFVMGAVFLPAETRTERTRVIGVPPETVFAEVNSFRNWESWSPWVHRDPTIESTYNDVAAGPGAETHWTSENSGSGTQRIVVSEPPRRIETTLDFGDMGTARAYWKFEPVSEGTRVTWGFVSPNHGPMQKWLGLMVERFVGDDYETGLELLAAKVEGR